MNERTMLKTACVSQLHYANKCRVAESNLY